MRAAALLLILAGSCVANAEEVCPATQPLVPAFVPPHPYSAVPPSDSVFLFGTDALWVALPRHRLPLREKLFWWRPGLDGRNEQHASLPVTIRALRSGATIEV